jgi:hypothetical protein
MTCGSVYIETHQKRHTELKIGEELKRQILFNTRTTINRIYTKFY